MPLPPIIDSHAHLQFEQYTADLEEVLARARDAGVATIITVGTDLDSSRAAVELAGRHPTIHATVGIHPHDAATLTPDVMAELAQLARHPKVVAIGETGLDFYYNHAPRDTQLTAFREQLHLAKTLRLPVVIHSREAKEETLNVLQEVPGITGVLHCFTGDLDMAQRAIGMGLYISFSGIITFANAGPLRDVAKEIPLEHLMIETDCPFLTPTPYRGKRNEPAFVARIAEEIATLTPSATLDQIRFATRQNTATLFHLS
jgi:TatD DNase family protein